MAHPLSSTIPASHPAGQAKKHPGAVDPPRLNTPPASPPLRESIVAKLGFYFLLLYLFLYLSRVLEMIMPSARLTMVLNLLFLFASVLTMSIINITRTRSGLFMIGFILWIAACVPFSVWKGGSVDVVIQSGRSLLLMACIIGLASTSKRCMQLMYTMGFAMAVASGTSFVSGERSGAGRLALEGGTFGDPNTYSLYLLMGMPFLWLKAKNSPNVFQKLLPYACVVPVLATSLGTGSRSGLITLIVMLLLLFWNLPLGKKAVFALSVSILAVGSTFFLSDYLLMRYTTFFSTDEEALQSENYEQLSGADVSSAKARRYLLQRSIELTVRNPIFGVGPGMFAIAEADDAEAKGYRGAWHETHNTYTQVSSEAGLPGLFFYAAALITGWRSLSKIRKTRFSLESQPVRHAAMYLQISYSGILMGVFFLSLAYTGLLFILTGLAAALARAVHLELLQGTLTLEKPVHVELYPRPKIPVVAARS
ncbi:MAG: O-antigen ligase family protein [Bryobacteraceae bacterium]